MNKTITAIKRGFKAARQAMGTHQSRIPKYQNVWCTLLGLAFGLIWLSDHPVWLKWLSDHIGPAAISWISELGFLALAAAMAVGLAGSVAERREWEAKHKTSSK